MQLGWIDFSKEDRQKALDVINLLSEQGAVDELGIIHNVSALTHAHLRSQMACGFYYFMVKAVLSKEGKLISTLQNGILECQLRSTSHSHHHIRISRYLRKQWNRRPFFPG